MERILQPSAVSEWLAKTFAEPTAAQARAWPAIERGANVLIVTPAGAGKTSAALFGILNELAMLHASGRLDRTVYALYISTTPRVADDIDRNLLEPLAAVYGDNPPFVVGSYAIELPADREANPSTPPHILLTTPEGLCDLLSQPEWVAQLERLRWIIADDIDAIAETKRGADLSLSMERLEHLVKTAAARRHVDTTQFFKQRVGLVQRIGLTAPIAAQEVAQFLVGTDRACEIIDVSKETTRRLQVLSLPGDEPYPPPNRAIPGLLENLCRLVKASRRSLILTITASGAEAIAFWLCELLPDLAANIVLSESPGSAEPRVLVCPVHLEPKIDTSDFDVVIVLSRPKRVPDALRCAGALVATNATVLIESCAIALLARTHQLDPVRLPNAPLDVLAHHLVSMGCAQRWTREAAFKLVLGSFIYRDLPLREFDDVLTYLASGGTAVQQHSTGAFSKIALDRFSFEARDDNVCQSLRENAVTRPAETQAAILLKGRTLGTIEESSLRHLEPGDVFTIAGRTVRVERLSRNECFVAATKAPPTTRAARGHEVSLAGRVADAITRFRREMRSRLGNSASTTQELSTWIDGQLDCDAESARLLLRLLEIQQQLSTIPSDDFLLVEDFLDTTVRAARGKRQSSSTERHYLFHSLIGRAANDALARVVAVRLSRSKGATPLRTANDYGFVITVAATQSVSAAEVPTLLAPANLDRDLRESLSKSNLLKYYFHGAAQNGLLISSLEAVERKTVRKLQLSPEIIFNLLQRHEPDHVLMRQAWRDIFDDLEFERALRFATTAVAKPVRLHKIDRIPPLSFPLMAKKATASLASDEAREATEALFAKWWKEANPIE